MILVNLTGVVSDNYFLSGSFYSLRCSEGAFWVQSFSVFHFNKGLYFSVVYMKNYGYLWTISYDVIILVSYSQGEGSKFSVFKFFCTGGFVVQNA